MESKEMNENNEQEMEKKEEQKQVPTILQHIEHEIQSSAFPQEEQKEDPPNEMLLPDIREHHATPIPVVRRGSKFDLQQEGLLLRPDFSKAGEQKGDKLWKHMANYTSPDVHSIQRQIVNHLEYSLARTRFNFDNPACYYATSFSVRDRLLEGWNDTNFYFYKKDPKRVYYMSMEFLMGRMLQNALVNIGLERQYRDALEDFGYTLEEIYEEEKDPGLGNGGLGRLAACFLDSMATLDLPAWGYGIRYNYGIFKQEIKDGYQVEVPDYWLTRGNPWEIERSDVAVNVKFYGRSVKKIENGVERWNWEADEIVQAIAYDTPIPGYNTFNVNNLRLWRACPGEEFDFKSFNTGDYFGAVKAKQKAESITSVLYPNDTTFEGKELRLKQEYFFVSATLQDIIRRFRKKRSHVWNVFSDKVAVQLNDTHPALCITELMRLLIDEHKLPYDEAYDIMHKTFAYTNHTVLPEALEKWDIPLISKLLPRHLDFIYMLNHNFLETVRKTFPGNDMLLRNLSFIEEGDIKKARMANMCVALCHTVNGVAALHSQILRNSIFKDFVDFFNKLDYAKFKDKLINVTNGVTPRRWIVCANPKLTELINSRLGHEEWILNLDLLKQLEPYSEDGEFQFRWMEVKRYNKLRLSKWVEENCGVKINVNALFDVMVKRIHEYKRQLLNILHVIYRYLQLKEMKPEQRKNAVPRVVMIGGKAAPGYANAKKIIKLINSVGEVVNKDKDIGDLLKVIFLPNYSVSNAQIIIPAAELSQHISTAGAEASGTSNMKFVMNGSLIIGTMDGANVEIAEEINAKNMFVIGANVNQVKEYKKAMADGKRDYVSGKMKQALNAIFGGRFGNLSEMHEMLGKLLDGGDNYILGWDFESYAAGQNAVDECYRNQKEWQKRTILGCARSGKFSTDRTIKEYAEKVWHAVPLTIPKPGTGNALKKEEKEQFFGE